MEAFFAESTAKQVLPEVFSQFISGWHKKMNPLVFVKLAIEASRQMSLPEAAKLMEGIVAEVKQLSKPDGPILMVLASMEVAHYSLRRGDITGTKKTIESCAGVVESFVGVDPLVPATFYRVSADYDKVSSSGRELTHPRLFLTLLTFTGTLCCI